MSYPHILCETIRIKCSAKDIAIGGKMLMQSFHIRKLRQFARCYAMSPRQLASMESQVLQQLKLVKDTTLDSDISTLGRIKVQILSNHIYLYLTVFNAGYGRI